MKCLLPNHRTWYVVALLFAYIATATAQKTVRYDLYVKDTLVNYAGKSKRAIAVNGQIPMPTLTFTQGDTAEIVVHNHLKESTSLHWHGVFLPNKEDGVPWLTQKPIAPGSSYTYRFPVVQNGTHWYHSHSGFQEQIGMHGTLLFNKKDADPTFRKGIDDLPTLPVLLSEWTNINPKNINRMLHNGNDWAAIKKKSTQSYVEALSQGHFKTKFMNEWKRMTAMDVSDVYYDQVQINGQQTSHVSSINGKALQAGQPIRLRIANGGASSYFWLRFSGGKIKVVASDGNDIEPIEVDRLLIAVSETYDIVVTLPENNKAFELMATTEDRSQSAHLILGQGPLQTMEELPRLSYFEGMQMMNGMMKTNGEMMDMGMHMSLNQMDMNSVMYPELNTKNTMNHEHTMPPATTNSSKEANMPMNSDQPAEDKIPASTHKHQDITAKKMSSTMDNTNSPKKVSADSHTEPMNHQKPTENLPILSATDSTATAPLVTLNYSMLTSPVATTLPNDAPVKELHFTLTGNMNRYIWSMDNKILSEVDKIPVKKGEILRITLTNNSMMRHPMHLHGFDFRVLNGKGDLAPLKNVLDIMPMETDTIEFLANRNGDWFFHCHILYHMMSGMNRVFEVGDYDNPNLPDKAAAYKMLQKESNMNYFSAQNDFATNGNDGKAMFQNARWEWNTEWRLGYNATKGYEIETRLGRYVDKNQWLMPFIGFDWQYRKRDQKTTANNMFGQENNEEKWGAFNLGFSYTLPLLIRFQTQVYQDGWVRMTLLRDDIPVAPRVRAGFMVNTDKEYMIDLSYILNKNMRIRTHYDSDMGFGVGMSLNY